MKFTIYLAGQIHDDWRKKVAQLIEERNLPFDLVAPQTNHDLSDDIGEKNIR